MECRPGCGACCIAPSISSPIPGMPLGKPGGIRCCQLDDDNRCKIFTQAGRPQVCHNFTAGIETCGDSMEDALHILTELELLTR